jgi:VIT1/CCC1 family predicted Fe2+/Mn2+ transporter
VTDNNYQNDLEAWREEKSSSWLYGVAEAAEPDPHRQKLFRDLAVAAEEQAAIVARGMDPQPPPFSPTIRARLVALLTRALTPERTRVMLASMKVRGVSIYTQPDIEMGHIMPTSVTEFGGRHSVGQSGTLRAGVFGVNDGLISNTCLIFGVAGAVSDARIILLTGIAGLLAGAFSMAAGEYISMRSQRELYEYQIAQEREELERYPDEEAEELALIYNARGLPMEEARRITKLMIANPEQALNTLAREELGLNPDELGSPWGAAGSSFISFCVGAVLPLIPFLMGLGAGALPVAAWISGGALFLVGAVLSLFSGRNGLYGGARMLLIGAAAGVATYTIGTLLGIGIG